MKRISLPLKIAGIFLGLLLLALTCLVAFPSWVLRPSVLSRVTTYLDSVGVHLEYELNSGNLSWGGWAKLNVDLDLAHFCLRTEGIEELCLNEAKVEGSLKLLPFEILQIRQLDVKDAKLKLSPPTAPSDVPPETSESEGFNLPSWLTTLGRVQINRFILEAPNESGGLTQANAGIQCSPKPEDRLGCSGSLTLAIQDKEQKTNLRVTFDLLKPRDRLAGDIKVQLTLRDPSIPLKHVRLDGHLDNEYDSLEFTGDISADEPLPLKLGVERCKLSGFHGDTLGVEHCKLSPVVRTIKNIEVKMDLSVEGQLHLTERRGKASVQIGASGAKSLTAKGMIEADFSPCKDGVALKVKPTSALTLELSQYQDIVNTLRKTQWAIPAPLNTLSGKVLLNAEGIKAENSRIVVPVSLTTQLDSQTQQLHTEVSGTFSMGECLPNTEMALDLKSVLKEVALDLPPLSLSEPPQLAPDPRIGNASSAELPKEEEPKPSFPWHVVIRTDEKSAIRLKSNLASKPIRLKTEMDLSSSNPPSGYIEVLPLELELFRRTATVKSFRATLLKERSDETVLDIEGLLNVEYPDYSVDIKISGTSKSPRVNMQSSPPLSQREIIALLLFGEVPAGLDFDKNESIQNMDAALAERSIGLASLYFFAKTPIQSVSYNPNTKGITVRVRLGDKTVISATGTGSGPNRIGLRRRIGKHWAVSTELDLDETSQSTPMSSFLEWFTRY
ncbi:MAG: translocation/assembly module TamB domain-containing protein [Bdellovibrionota bacterium]